MSNPGTEPVADGGFKITLNPDLQAEAEAVLDFLTDRENLARAHVIKSNMVRTVYRAEHSGVRFILKRYHTGGIGDAVKYLFAPSRATTEWRAMQRIHSLGIPTSRPIVFGEKRRFGVLADSFFAADYIDNSISFGPCTLGMKIKGRWNDAIRDLFFDKLARLTAGLHDANVFHADFHLGNVLVADPHGDDPEIYVIDLHSVKFPARLSRGNILLNLARVAESLRQLGDGEVRIFLEKYLELRPDFASSAAGLESEVWRRVATLDRRKLRSRTRRCLIESSRFTPARTGGFRMNLRRPCTASDALKAIRIHDTVGMTDDDRLIPPSNKNKVTVVEIPAEPKSSAEPKSLKLCVKEYRRKNFLRRIMPLASEARRSWIAGLGLEVRGIATPETIAWVRGRGREFVITRYLTGASKLHAYAAARRDSLPPEEAPDFTRNLVEDLAHFMRMIHDGGVRHHDLCEQNILVAEDRKGRTLYLTDLDTVTFGLKTGRGRIIKNLVQLGHMPGDVDLMLKARFLKLYVGPCPVSERLDLFRCINAGVLSRMEAKRKRYFRRGDPDPHPMPSAFRKSWSGI